MSSNDGQNIALPGVTLCSAFQRLNPVFYSVLRKFKVRKSFLRHHGLELLLQHGHRKHDKKPVNFFSRVIDKSDTLIR